MSSWRRRLEVDLPAVFGTTGITFMVMGAAQLLPALVAVFSGDPALPLFSSAVFTFAVGFSLLPLRRRTRKWTRRESLATVALSWGSAVVLAAIPFVALQKCGPIDALVESASGLTTTGATIFPDVDQLRTGTGSSSAGYLAPLHLWRALTHWLGGAGIVLVVLVLAPWLGEEAETLRRTQLREASFLTERYGGSTRSTLRGLFSVYVGATLVLTLVLIALDVHPWNALLHAFATISTGGFSPHTSSLGGYGAAVQLVVIVFMLLGALNFAVLGRVVDELGSLWRKTRREEGALKALAVVNLRALPTIVVTLWRDGEVRGYLLLVGCVCVAMAGTLFWSSAEPVRYAGASGLGQAALDASFTTTSISTTTGFGTEDYTGWPPACQVMLLALMVVGGCSGSTAGGIKFRRLAIVCKVIYREVRLLPRPRGVIHVKLGNRRVPEEQVREATRYVATYGILVIAIAVAIALSGSDPVSAGAASVSSAGSIGPAFGDCSPSGSFQPYAPAAKLACVVAMLLGRLEIFALLALCFPSFWVRRGTRHLAG